MENVQFLSRNLKQIANLYTKILSKELAAVELDHHFEILLLLDLQKTPITQNKLAELLKLDKSRIVGIIYELEQKGLIDVKRNPADRREHFINLSGKAKTAIPAIEKVVAKINDLAKAGIPQDKLLTFIEVSEQLQSNLEKANTI
jgi:DNA-binding MarR family transcriptional regulator